MYFKIPGVLHIGRDEFGRLEATESNYQSLATIKVNWAPDRVIGGTPDEVIVMLRRRALEAYRDGKTEIDL